MSQTPLLALLVLASAAPILPAQQTHIAPAGFDYETSGGDDGSLFLTNFQEGIRAMQVIDSDFVGFANGTISEVAFRHSSFWSQSWPSNQQVRISLGTTSLSPDQLPEVFSQIPDAPMTEVFSGPFTFPSATSQAIPEAWDVVFPLQTPFAYDVADGNLVLEIETVQVGDPSQFWNADPHARDSFGAGMQILSPGCSGFKSQMSNGFGDPIPGGSVRFFLTYSPTILTGLSMIGLPSSGFPLDLSAFGSPPGCFAQFLPLASQPFQLSASLWTASASVEWSIPPNPALTGVSFDHQAVLLGSPFTGPITPRTSTAHRIYLGSPTGKLPAVTQLLRGAAGSATGQISEGSLGYIVRFKTL